jgi:transposase
VVVIPADLEAKIRRLFHAESWPIRTIAGQLGVHHSTVRRALLRDGVPLSAVPTRRSKADPYVPFIVQTLEKHPDLRASRLFEMVKERGYEGAPDHFRAVVARHRPKRAAEAFLRLTTLPGEQAQVDWGHFGHIEIEGARRPLVAFVMVLSWSRWMFLRFGVDQRMGSFLAHHEAAFEELGGVPRVVLYDNLKSAVTQRIGDDVVFNPTLLAYSAHQRYEPRPCAPYRGNEKGRVERGIRDVRESFMPARTWTDLADLNRQAAAWCRNVRGARKNPEDKTLTVLAAFTEERTKLRALPNDAFPVADRVDVVVAKTPYARFDGNDYSVPHTRVRRTVTVVASPDIVRVLDGTEEIARHGRCWGKGRVIEDPAHIQALVAVKADARENRGMARVFTAVPVARGLISALAGRGGNIAGAVARLGELLDAFGAAALSVAIDEALAADAPHVGAVRQVLDRRRQETNQPPPIPVTLPDNPKVRDVVVAPRSLGVYDQLGGKKGGDRG